MARFAVRRLQDIPQIATEPRDPEWYALQQYFGLTAFGANWYVAKNDGDELLAEHDEGASGQEELYLVIAGNATFTIDGEDHDAPAVTVVAIPDPSVRRKAIARTAGTAVVAVGGERQDEFRSSWRPKWFENAPRL